MGQESNTLVFTLTLFFPESGELFHQVLVMRHHPAELLPGPRQRNLWVTDAFEWRLEVRLAPLAKRRITWLQLLVRTSLPSLLDATPLLSGDQSHFSLPDLQLK
jgi:hypothetical protein